MSIQKKVPYIAIEGIKGVGKSTVISLLKEKLSHITYVQINPTARMEGYSWIEFVNQYLPLRKFDWWVKILYAHRSNQQAIHAKKKIVLLEQTNNPAQFILGDRSIITSLVTRWNQNNRDIHSYFTSVRTMEYAIPIPDHVIYLHASMETIQSRIKNRERKYGAEDETLSRLLEAHQIYMQIQQGILPSLDNITWHMVSAEDSPDTVSEELYLRIIKILE